MFQAREHLTQKIVERPIPRVETKSDDKKLTTGRFNLHEVAELLRESVWRIKSVEGKEVVLVIGNTGSGKSTTIDYMIDVPIEKNGRKAIAKPLPGQRYAKIGEKGGSETFYPEAFESKELVTYCDFPGFMDTGIIEKNICTSINSQLAIELMKGIRSIMVVIDFNSFFADRGAGLKNLGETLARSFKGMDVDALAKSILFVITKIESPTIDDKNEVMMRIDELIAVQEENLSALMGKVIDSSESQQKREKIYTCELNLFILDLMKKNYDNLVFIDVFDKTGKSKQHIHEKLFKLVPLSKNAINFGENDAYRREFNDVIEKILGKGTLILREKNQHPIRMQDCIQQIENSHEQIKFYSDQIPAIEAGHKQLKYINELSGRINRNNSIIKHFQQEMKAREESSAKKNAELKEKDNDKDDRLYRSVYLEESKVEAIWNLTLDRYYLYKFDCKEDASKHITKVVTIAADDGEFSDEMLNKAENRYTVNYKFRIKKYLIGGFFVAAKDRLIGKEISNKGNIKIFIRSKDFYATEIAVLKSALAFDLSRYDELKKEIEDLTNENEVLTRAIMATHSGQQEVKQKSKIEMERSKQNYEERIKKLEETHKQLENQLQQLEDRLTINLELFEAVAVIVRTITIPSCQSLAKEFLHQLESSKRRPAVISFQSDKHTSDELSCFLTKQRMQNPWMLTTCGHTFEYKAIHSHFDALKKNGQELCCPLSGCLSPKTSADSMQLNTALKKLIEEEDQRKILALRASTSTDDEETLQYLTNEVERLGTEYQLKQLELAERRMQWNERNLTLVAQMPATQRKLLNPKHEEMKQLFQAADEKSIVQLRKLYLQRIDFHIKEENTGDTILHRAAAAGSGEEIISFLIDECGCQLDALNLKDETPLFRAVDKRCIETTRCLVQKGANLNIQYHIKAEIVTILQYALRRALPLELIKILVSQEMVEVDDALKINRLPVLHLIAQEGHNEALEFFVMSKKANINVRDEKGETPLIRAAKHGKLMIVKTLIDYNAEFNGDGKSEKEILHSKNISEEIKNRLKNYVANLQIRKREALKKVGPVTKDITYSLVTINNIELKHNRQHNPLEELIQTTLAESEILASLMMLWIDESLESLEREIKTAAPKSSKSITSENFASFIAAFLSYKIKEKFIDWNQLIEKEKHKKEKQFGSLLKETIKQAIKFYMQSTPRGILLEEACLKIIVAIRNKDKVIPIQLFMWLKMGELASDKLKNLDIRDCSLKEKIVEELVHSIDEINSLKQPEIIFNLRVKCAIDCWLPGDDVVLAELMQDLRKNLKEHGVKDKKIGIISYLSKPIFCNYPKEDPLLNFLKKYPDKKKSFIDYLCVVIQKDKTMKHFSTNTLKQDAFKNQLPSHIRQWISQQVKHEQKPLPLSLADQQSVRALSGSPVLFKPSSDITRQAAEDVLERKLGALSDKQNFFITYFCQEFEKFYCMYKALGFKMVQRLEDKTDQVAKKIAEYKHTTLAVSGFEIPVGMIGDLIAKLVVYRKDKSLEEAAKRIGWLFGERRIDQNGNLIIHAAEIIARRYQWQINALTPECVAPLGICAARRCIQYVTASDDNLINNPGGLFSGIMRAIYNALSDEKYGPIMLFDYKDPLIALVTGVIVGESAEDENAHLTTTDKQSWVPRGIFRNVGYVVNTDKGRQFYTHERLIRKTESGHNKGLLRYGYCWIEEWEIDLIKKAGYSLEKEVSAFEQLSSVFEEVQPEATNGKSLSP